MWESLWKCVVDWDMLSSMSCEIQLATRPHAGSLKFRDTNMSSGMDRSLLVTDTLAPTHRCWHPACALPLLHLCGTLTDLEPCSGSALWPVWVFTGVKRFLQEPSSSWSHCYGNICIQDTHFPPQFNIIASGCVSWSQSGQSCIRRLFFLVAQRSDASGNQGHLRRDGLWNHVSLRTRFSSGCCREWGPRLYVPSLVTFTSCRRGVGQAKQAKNCIQYCVPKWLNRNKG